MKLVERLRLGGPNALEVTDKAADEIERLREIIVNLHNRRRHEFSAAVEAAADKLFADCSVLSTEPFKEAE